jgi:hypothetical protein
MYMKDKKRPTPPKPRPGISGQQKPGQSGAGMNSGYGAATPGGFKPFTKPSMGRGAATPGGFNAEDFLMQKNQARGNAIMKKLKK